LTYISHFLEFGQREVKNIQKVAKTWDKGVRKRFKHCERCKIVKSEKPSGKI
jgi:hypothetical protein